MANRGMVRETVTVVAKTYPECSHKYGCLVCTAGINDAGDWRRLYPIPWSLFWGKAPKLSFQKWSIISVPMRKKTQDRRKESYWVNPYTIEEELKVVGDFPEWQDRLRFLGPHVDPDLETLWDSDRSLGLIRPQVIDDFLQKERHRMTDPDEVLTVERTEQAQQLLLFDFEPELIKQSRIPPEPLPWLGYRFTCHGVDCRGHEMMCIDWEIQQLYRKVGIDKTRQKALWMGERDLYFVVGTTWRYHTWMIIGLFYPPKETGHGLFRQAALVLDK